MPISFSLPLDDTSVTSSESSSVVSEASELDKPSSSETEVSVDDQASAQLTVEGMNHPLWFSIVYVNQNS